MTAKEKEVEDDGEDRVFLNRHRGGEAWAPYSFGLMT